MRENIRDKKALLALLAASPHGKLGVYTVPCLTAAQDDPDFYSRLIAWHHRKGQIRDAKIALPILALKALAERKTPLSEEAIETFLENALAHVADLRPREFVRAIEFGWDIKAPTRLLKRLTIRYLRDLEVDRRDWERTALLHRSKLRWLYAQAQIPVKVHGGEAALFGKFRNTVVHGLPVRDDRGETPPLFKVVASLKHMTPIEIGGMIDRYKLPFLIARDALGPKATEPDVVLALMKRMTTTELVTNMKWLKRVGVQTIPALRATLEAMLGKAGTEKAQKKQKGAVLKTTRAAEALADDEALSGKLRVLQEKQLEHLPTIEGDWLVLADKSGSMEEAMAAAKVVADTLSRMVRGKVHLVFFDEEPQYFDVTGKTLEDIKALTATMSARGGTFIGCGVDYLLDRKIKVDGIALVSDGCENIYTARPGEHVAAHKRFFNRYAAYVKAFDVEPIVYWYRVKPAYSAQAVQMHGAWQVQHTLDLELGEFRRSIRDIDVQEFDISGNAKDGTNDAGIDYFSVMSLVPTMRLRRYELLDEIRAVPLRRLDETLKATTNMAVLPQRNRVMV